MATTAAMQKVAEDFGYQLAFLKSDKELWAVFQKAVNGSWAAPRFVAAVRNTRWYKTHSETYRSATQLRYSDPATFDAKVREQRQSLATLARQIGAPIPGAEMLKLATEAVMFGWTADQARDRIARYSKGSNIGGEAASTAQALKMTAFRNGVTLSDTYIHNAVRQVALGNQTVENAQQVIRNTYAKSVAPGFAKELEGGQDLYDLASPYMQTMAKTLELNPSDLDLFDPTIRKALATSSDKDGQAGSVPLWQFERDLKKDRRWMATNGARNEVDKTTRNLAQMFGTAV